MVTCLIPEVANYYNGTRSPSDYLAHEFLNETWEPLYSIDVAQEMLKAELTYLGSATLVDNHEALVIDSSAAEVIDGPR